MLCFSFSGNYFRGKLKSIVPMQIRILTIFATFSSIQLTLFSHIKVPRNTPCHLECANLIKFRRKLVTIGASPHQRQIVYLDKFSVFTNIFQSFAAKPGDSKSVKTTWNKSWKLEVESFGNYAGQSYELIRR